MRKIKRWYCLFWVLMFMSLMLNIYPVYSVDELLLSGIVKSVDYKSKIVIVDVKSKSCPGMRSFKVEDISKMESSIGKEISFKIDSSTCMGDTVYKMILLEGKRR